MWVCASWASPQVRAYLCGHVFYLQSTLSQFIWVITRLYQNLAIVWLTITSLNSYLEVKPTNITWISLLVPRKMINNSAWALYHVAYVEISGLYHILYLPMESLLDPSNMGPPPIENDRLSHCICLG